MTAPAPVVDPQLAKIRAVSDAAYALAKLLLDGSILMALNGELGVSWNADSVQAARILRAERDSLLQVRDSQQESISGLQSALAQARQEAQRDRDLYAARIRDLERDLAEVRNASPAGVPTSAAEPAPPTEAPPSSAVVAGAVPLVTEEARFLAADYYDARESERFSCESPDEAIEEVLQDVVADAEDVEAAIRAHGPITVNAHMREVVGDDWIKDAALRAADRVESDFAEEFGDPDGDMDGVDPEALAAAILPAVRAQLAATTVWRCEKVASRTYSEDEVVALMRKHSPEWFEKAETLEPVPGYPRTAAPEPNPDFNDSLRGSSAAGDDSTGPGEGNAATSGAPLGLQSADHGNSLPKLSQQSGAAVDQGGALEPRSAPDHLEKPASSAGAVQSLEDPAQSPVDRIPAGTGAVSHKSTPSPGQLVAGEDGCAQAAPDARTASAHEAGPGGGSAPAAGSMTAEEISAGSAEPGGRATGPRAAANLDADLSAVLREARKIDMEAAEIERKAELLGARIEANEPTKNGRTEAQRPPVWLYRPDHSRPEGDPPTVAHSFVDGYLKPSACGVTFPAGKSVWGWKEGDAIEKCAVCVAALAQPALPPARWGTAAGQKHGAIHLWREGFAESECQEETTDAEIVWITERPESDGDVCITCLASDAGTEWREAFAPDRGPAMQDRRQPCARCERVTVHRVPRDPIDGDPEWVRHYAGKHVCRVCSKALREGAPLVKPTPDQGERRAQPTEKCMAPDCANAGVKPPDQRGARFCPELHVGIELSIRREFFRTWKKTNAPPKTQPALPGVADAR